MPSYAPVVAILLVVALVLFATAICFGSMGLFVTLLYLFIRFLPVISIFEMRTMLPTAEVREGHG